MKLKEGEFAQSSRFYRVRMREFFPESSQHFRTANFTSAQTEEIDMKSRLLATLLAACAALCVSSAVRADVLAHWTFEVTVPTTAGPHAAEAGDVGGQATGFHTSTATVYSNPVGNGSLESFSSNNWSTGDYYQFQTSTLGYHSIAVQWDQTRSSTGPGTFDLQWSDDGVNFLTLLDDYNIDAISWSSLTYNPLSTYGPIELPAAANNKANVYIRMTSQVTSASAGTNRIDDVIITGVIPEPTSLALLALGGVLLRRRRESR